MFCFIFQMKDLSSWAGNIDFDEGGFYRLHRDDTLEPFDGCDQFYQCLNYIEEKAADFVARTRKWSISMKIVLHLLHRTSKPPF